MHELTQLLRSAADGDRAAGERVLTALYADLHRLAHRQMRQAGSLTLLDTTALVHEAWLRLGQSDRQEWRGREHFFSAAAEAMRRVLVENARRKLRVRHGGQWERVDFELVDLPVAADDEKCVRISEALDQLEAIDSRKAKVVKLHLFTGLELKEIATVLGASEKTIQRDWSFAKAWLSRELKSAR